MKNTKKFFILGATALMTMSLVGCSKKTDNSVDNAAADEPVANNTTEEDVEIANPWTEVADLTEAYKVSNINFMAPATLNGKEMSFVQTLGQQMVEVRYGNEGNEIVARKGLSDEDISGDYNTYSEEETYVIKDIEVLMKGSESLVSNITWEDDEGYKYSITCAPASLDEATAMVEAIVGETEGDVAENPDLAVEAGPATEANAE